MTEEQIIRDRLIFKAIRGSKAYGTNIEGSDEDFVGIYIQTDEDLTGLKYIPQISLNNGNDVYYELRRFFELAMVGNPNIMEIFNTPEDCIVYKHPLFTAIEGSRQLFLTKLLFESFANYARSQIKKAKGFNKKMNWDKNKVTRKTVLDFCYVLGEREESIPFKEWKWDQRDIGLAKVNNVPDLYSMYLLRDFGGIISEDSNDVQLRSIPKDAMFLGYIRFDKNAYSTHCKHYREYVHWNENKNMLRYNMNLEHGKGYDAKNMMHCLRLINTAIDIAEKKEIIVRRSPEEVETLLKVRKGEMDYINLVAAAERKIEIAEEAFAKSNLPESVDREFVHNYINQIRWAYKNIIK